MPTLTEQELKELDECMKKDLEENGRHWCCHCYTRYKEPTVIPDVCPECLKIRYAEHGAEAKGCAFCENLTSDSDCDDMGYTYSFWYECEAMPQYQGLNTFPFNNTPKKCIENGCFKPRKSKYWACQ
jgi:hypothetical protein